MRVVHLNDFFKLCNTWIGKIVHIVLEIEDSTSFNDFLIETNKSTFLDFPFFVNMNLYKQEVINRLTVI